MEVSPKEEDEGRRRSSCCSSAHSSPEFEFWFPRNPSSFPEPDQLSSADQLFGDGFLLPLQFVHGSQSSELVEPTTPTPSPPPGLVSVEQLPSPSSSASIMSASARSVTSSQRWKDILFKKPKAPISPVADGSFGEKKMGKKTRTREKKGGSGVASAELNINIWPFSRSRSAGTGSNRPKLPHPGSTRKVSSAPCSRSNSSGESKSKMLPKSPVRAHGGVYLARSSPVWQARRAGANPGENTTAKKQVTPCKAVNVAVVDSDPDVPTGGKIKNGKTLSPRAKILNLTVPMCIGYRPHLSCRADQQYTSVDDRPGSDGCEAPDTTTAGFSGNILNLRTLFSKKVY